MTKNPDRKKRTHGPKSRVCRVAYTINNTQPVRSTIIGDQPLFYMDYESEWADEERLSGYDALEFSEFDGAETGFFQDYDTPELVQMSDDIDDLDAGIARMEQFMVDAFDISTPAEVKISFSESLIDETASLIEKSRFAAALYGQARIHGISLETGDHVEKVALDLESKKIFIHPKLDVTDATLGTVRELRRFWQKIQGALIHPLAFHPDQAILVNRAQQADLDVAILRAAWEMQLSGIREPWERVESSSLADLTGTFAREAFMDFRTLNNGEAAAATFESWFLSERCRRLDKSLIQQMLADYSGIVFGGEPVAHTVAAQVIGALGTVPFGKNYLEPHARMIMTDPIFTEVRDRANANFLWFIKFEKSFREAEQELQQESGTPAPSFSAGASTPEKRKDTHGSESQNIVQFPLRPASAAGNTKRRRGKARAGSADIIFLPTRSRDGSVL